MKLKDLQPSIKELLAIFEALRKLGFNSEDIFFTTHDGNIPCVVLKQGSKEVALTTGIPFQDHGVTNFHNELTNAADIWNEQATDNERDQIFMNSKVFKNGIQLVLTLLNEKIILPSNIENTVEDGFYLN